MMLVKGLKDNVEFDFDTKHASIHSLGAMRQLLLLTILFYAFLSCNIKTEKTIAKNSIQLLVPDTTNNEKAKRDLERIEHCSQISKQLGLENLEKGVDSFEVRLWDNFSFSNSEELFVIKILDTTYRISFYRLYLRGFDYDNNNRNRQWNHFTEPIVDSSISKTVLIHRDDLKNLDLQEVWQLHSQSELKIPDSIGFTDCYSNTIEVADKKRYKFISHHCPTAYYDKLKLKDILDFINYFQSALGIVYKYHSIIPNKYD